MEGLDQKQFYHIDSHGNTREYKKTQGEGRPI